MFLRQRINRSKKPKTDLNHDLNNSQTFSSDDGFGFNFTPKNQSGLLKHSLNLEFNSQDHLSVGSQISLQIPPEQGPEIKFDQIPKKNISYSAAKLQTPLHTQFDTPKNISNIKNEGITSDNRNNKLLEDETVFDQGGGLN